MSTNQPCDIWNESGKEKFVDWFGYSASVSPFILEQFEKEVGYKFRPEFIIDQGYYNNQYRIPSKEFKDFMAFQRREVAKLAKEMVDITHELGKEAMMFLGDHWIGTEPIWTSSRPSVWTLWLVPWVTAPPCASFPTSPA